MKFPGKHSKIPGNVLEVVIPRKHQEKNIYKNPGHKEIPRKITKLLEY